MFWQLGPPYNDYSGAIDGVVIVIEGVTETDTIDKLSPQVRAILGRCDAMEYVPKEKPVAMVKFKLGKNYENFSGLLNNVYRIENGIFTCREEDEGSATKVLREHYGATKILSPSAPAAKAPAAEDAKK